MAKNQMANLAHVLLLTVIAAQVSGQAFYGDGLQQYFGQAPDVKPVQEETEDSPELSRYYRGETDTAQASLSFQPVQTPLQYSFQSPGFQQQQPQSPNYQQQQLQPLSYYQQQQLQPQVLYQQQAQPQAQLQAQPQAQLQVGQLRSLQAFADPQFQQDYKNRMVYGAQLNPTQPPPPAPITPQQQPSVFQFQPSQEQQQFDQLQQLGPQTQFTPSQQQLFRPSAQQFSQPQFGSPSQRFSASEGFAPQQFAPQSQQFASQSEQFAPKLQQFAPQSQQFAPQPQQFVAPQPRPFAAQQESAESPKLGVSYSSAGLVSRTSFSGLGASYSF